MTSLVETLGDLQFGEQIEVLLDDGSTIRGEASLIDYDPEKRLRIEIENADEDSRVRYDISAELENNEWTTPQARRYTPDQDDWIGLGEVTSVGGE
ncbi:hypothetical protein [Haladaptatus halobius]|uniref:hypothetical protein n=1 Tax=Haladaptatus halobius TaxID=2884875 RepID=UPI001D0B0683|nr:hypothetical protein [Haladaptatus halobius]